MKLKLLVIPALLASLLGCEEKEVAKKIEVEKPKPVYVSTYQPLGSEEFVITNATVLVGNGERHENTSVWVKSGKIKGVGQTLQYPKDITIYDGKGKWVTPGLIDVHSHLGVYPSPSHEANEDGNEMTEPVTAQVWAEHAVWTQDPGFDLARAGGVTSLQILPGSGNLIGGRGVTLKNVPSITVQGMKFPDAPHALKMACGENPKRVYGSKGRAPMTRMGNVAGYRKAWIDATAYKEKWDKYYEAAEQGEEKDKPKRDLKLETLAEVLRGNVLIHNHCYRAEEMAVMIDVAKEFNYEISTFHHAVEGYKIADLLAENNICAAMWADWWGFKHEAYDSVRENVAMVDKANACAIVHSDSAIGIQHLNQEAAKAMAAGNKKGLSLKPEDAIRWITLNPAKSIGLSEKVGSLETDKMADIVLWDQNPFSVYAKAEKVFVDGALTYDRLNKQKNPVSDFDLGIVDPQGERL
ncbi:amidohydrolase [Aliikangiella coralliicola]|uniref:Amidohydrolase n=1 Tax=Aliikangiella coralliicola TaxID=2592383 RepID=A0A545U659_9GAMM|nr:amidohydrolase [Aliikangiella coralliicola]TQV84893.1 amidohydrolase [Aliikangiella coralliicola]